MYTCEKISNIQDLSEDSQILKKNLDKKTNKCFINHNPIILQYDNSHLFSLIERSAIKKNNSILEVNSFSFFKILSFLSIQSILNIQSSNKQILIKVNKEVKIWRNLCREKFKFITNHPGFEEEDFLAIYRILEFRRLIENKKQTYLPKIIIDGANFSNYLLSFARFIKNNKQMIQISNNQEIPFSSQVLSFDPDNNFLWYSEIILNLRVKYAYKYQFPKGCLKQCFLNDQNYIVAMTQTNTEKSWIHCFDLSKIYENKALIPKISFIICNKMHESPDKRNLIEISLSKQLQEAFPEYGQIKTDIYKLTITMPRIDLISTIKYTYIKNDTYVLILHLHSDKKWLSKLYYIELNTINESAKAFRLPFIDIPIFSCVRDDENEAIIASEEDSRYLYKIPVDMDISQNDLYQKVSFPSDIGKLKTMFSIDDKIYAITDSAILKYNFDLSICKIIPKFEYGNIWEIKKKEDFIDITIGDHVQHKLCKIKISTKDFSELNFLIDTSKLRWINDFSKGYWVNLIETHYLTEESFYQITDYAHQIDLIISDSDGGNVIIRQPLLSSPKKFEGVQSTTGIIVISLENNLRICLDLLLGRCFNC